MILALVLAALLVFVVERCCLTLTIWTWWCARGRDVLLVHSDSPIWHDYFEENLLPHVRRRAVILNWSQRCRWRLSLAVLAFSHFGGEQEFNPLAVVFHPFRRSRTFRFYRPFHDLKHGKPEALQSMQRDFFDAIGVQSENS